MDQPQAAENLLSFEIIKAALEVHTVLGGPGLLESVYEEALVWELLDSGLHVERQKQLPIAYKGRYLADPLCIDVMVENLVLVECKATTQYHSVFEAQALTYLRLTELKLALVINFGEKFLKNGIKRVVNNL